MRARVVAWVLFALATVLVVQLFFGGADELPPWAQKSYEFTQDVIADLPADDRERIVLIPLGSTGLVPCWPLTLRWDGFSCVVANRVVLGYRAYTRAYIRGREVGVVFAVGHELAHLDQPLSSLRSRSAYGRERDADCRGGAYVAEVLGGTIGRTALVRSMLENAVGKMGSKHQPGYWDFHGTAEQRKEAVLLGFDGGERACLANRLF